MALDLQVVRTSAQFDQSAGNDVDEAPGKLAKGRGVAFTAELPGNARCYFRYTTEASHGVVTRGYLRPAQMEDIEFLFSTGPFGFDVHPFEQVGIALRIEDDHYLVFNAVYVLGDVHLGESRFANTGRAQHQCVSDPFAQWQADFRFVGLDAMQ